MLSTRISPSFEDLLQLGQADAIERRKMVKAFAAGTNAFPDRLDAWHTRPFYIAALGLVRDHLRRRFIDFKLSAHFLICAACSLSWAVRVSICFCCCATVASNFSTLPTLPLGKAGRWAGAPGALRRPG